VQLPDNLFEAVAVRRRRLWVLFLLRTAQQSVGTCDSRMGTSEFQELTIAAPGSRKVGVYNSGAISSIAVGWGLMRLANF
jgi:hypothetical protein